MNNSPGNPTSPSQPFAGAASPNTVLDNRYRLDGRIAAGGMGEVWRGLDQTLGRPVAVKLLRPEYASDESFLVRFRGEARHAARLSHPGVASVYDYGEVATADDYPTAYLVMELVEGEPLSAALHREKRLSPERMLDILGQAADALQAAHALGVVHRDVKPGNLLLRPDGAVKVTDFGIARAVDAAPLTATGIMMGTAYYVSPEQASGRPVTPASDVYSLGVVAYECLAGHRPFDDRNPIVVVMAHQQDTPRPLPADIPYQVRALVESAMAKDPARRPSSAGAFARSAAGIRRSLWSPDAGRWSGPGGASDMTARHPGPSTGLPAVGPGGRPHRPTSRNRPPSWVTPPPPTTGRTSGPGRAGTGPDYTQAVPGGPVGPPHDATEMPATAMHSPSFGADTGYGDPPPYRGERGGYGDETVYGNQGYRAGERGDNRDPGEAWQGRAARRRSGPAARQAVPLPLPVLIILLILTVAVTAFVTNKLFSSKGSESNSAATPPVVVYANTLGDEIVIGNAGSALSDAGGATAGEYS
ncbi:serine/threonine-protein kinase [Frankia gtarii]|uniref:serine/threonine-protein kinase n=1 Tax=Frankia gtarii TaxID=2950102 RepID=UPI0021C0C6F0|nr:serine/threonine-protein kinase [Frankia gtarii]